jgi:hypothetical protein
MAVLTVLEREASHSSSIFVFGIPPIRSIDIFQRPLVFIADWSAVDLNVVSAPLNTFVPFSPGATLTPERHRTPAD